MLSVVMLNVIMRSVSMLRVYILSFVLLAVGLSFIMPNAIEQSVYIGRLSLVILSFIMLTVIC
jgi:hypothetical protein